MKNNSSDSKVCVFTIEGNIGAGKSTLCTQLNGLCFDKEHVVLLEPSEDRPGTIDFDNQQNGFLFQMYVLQARMEFIYKQIKDNPGKIIIFERSYLTDHEVFAKLMLQQGIVSIYEYKVYLKWLKFMLFLINPYIKGIIYIKEDPNTCFTRIKHRERPGEETIDLQLIHLLHQQHEHWISNTSIPTLIINNIKDLDNLNKITSFINCNIASF